MSKTWRKKRRSNPDQTFKKPIYTPKRPKQALRHEIEEEGGSYGASYATRN